MTRLGSTVRRRRGFAPRVVDASAQIEAARRDIAVSARSVLLGTDTGADGPAERAGGWPAGRRPVLGAALPAALEWVLLVVPLALEDHVYVALGVSEGAVGIARMVALVAAAVGALVAAALVHGRRRRALVASTGLVVVALGSFVLAAATTSGVLIVGFGMFGAGLTAVQTGNLSLLADAVRVARRGQAFGWTRLTAALGAAAVWQLVFAVGGWRFAFAALGMAALAAAAAGALRRDPGYGLLDTVLVRAEVNRHSDVPADVEERLGLRWVDSVRQVFAGPAARDVVVAHVALAAAVFPLFATGSVFLREELLLPHDDRHVFAIAWLPFAGAAALVAGWWYDAKRSALPARWLPFLVLPLLAAVLFCLGVQSRNAIAAFSGFAAVVVTVSAVQVPLLATAFACVAAPLRAHVAALCTAAWSIGGMQGILFVHGLEGRYGARTALVVHTVAIALIAAVVKKVAHAATPDIDRVAGSVIEDQTIRAIRSRGQHVPLLSCRNVDFGYGSVQVLFDVSFNVDEGEMVALLGTNGAGKSTLLRVVSGLGRPWSGSVRLHGEDVTFLDPARRVDRGVLQIPGGKATFPRMTVAENLRAYAYSLRGGRVLNRRIDRVFEQFPRLAERRNQRASTLSGGESQMLALAKAMLLEPKVLLIDELSLGLAPIVVGDLLQLVRAINAEGTAVVLVEQSVNVALSLVDHAYFMEKGEIRFDGGARDLLDRDDLLRSVFLEGATGSRP